MYLGQVKSEKKTHARIWVQEWWLEVKMMVKGFIYVRNTKVGLWNFFCFLLQEICILHYTLNSMCKLQIMFSYISPSFTEICILCFSLQFGVIIFLSLSLSCSFFFSLSLFIFFSLCYVFGDIIVWNNHFATTLWKYILSKIKDTLNELVN